MFFYVFESLRTLKRGQGVREVHLGRIQGMPSINVNEFLSLQRNSNEEMFHRRSNKSFLINLSQENEI